MSPTSRGASSVVGIILIVGVTVIIGGTVTVFVLGLTDDTRSGGPTLSTTYSLVEDDGEQTIAVTHVGGDNPLAENLYVTASKPIDIGGPPDAPENTNANESFASPRERFLEGTSGPQVEVGERWEAGETVYLDPVGSVEDVTVQIAWSRQPVEGRNPGTPQGQDSFVVVEFTVGDRTE